MTMEFCGSSTIRDVGLRFRSHRLHLISAAYARHLGEHHVAVLKLRIFLLQSLTRKESCLLICLEVCQEEMSTSYLCGLLIQCTCEWRLAQFFKVVPCPQCALSREPGIAALLSSELAPQFFLLTDFIAHYNLRVIIWGNQVSIFSHPGKEV